MSTMTTEPATEHRWAHVGVVAVLFLAVADQRFLIAAETGGRGTLTISTFALPVLATLFLLRFGGRALTGFTSPAILWWVPYLFLSILLPMLAVVLGWYPERVLFAGMEAILAVSAMLIGSAAAVGFGSDQLPWRRWLVIAAVFQAAYALSQSLAISGALAGWPWTTMLEWDLATQGRFGELVAGRSAGFYINPNILGLWGAVTVILGLFLTSARSRLLVIGSGGMSILLSQSRGATFALVAALIIALVRNARPGPSAAGSKIAGVLALALGLSVLAGIVLIAMGFIDVAIFERMYLGLAAALGAGTDPGVTGRINLWAAALDLLGTRPLGTLGPPEFMLGAAVDNGWVRVLVQGSVPFAAALGLMLLPAFLRPLAATEDGQRLRALSMLIALAAVSQTPLSYPPVILYWFLVGAVLAQERQRRRAGARSQVIGTPPTPLAPQHQPLGQGGHP
jgi:hypothetical protein